MSSGKNVSTTLLEQRSTHYTEGSYGMSEKKALARYYIHNTIALLPAVPILAFGIALCLFAGLGTDVTTSCQQGFGNLVGLDVGTVNLLFNVLVLIIFLFANRSLVGVGSLLVGFCLGPLMNLFQDLLGILIPVVPHMAIRVGMSVLGTCFCALALAWYVPLNMGVQSTDMLILTISKWLKRSYGVAMYIYCGIMLLGTILMHGDIGVGTIINLVCCGKLCDLLMRLLHPLLLKVKKEKPEKITKVTEEEI